MVDLSQSLINKCSTDYPSTMHDPLKYLVMSHLFICNRLFHKTGSRAQQLACPVPAAGVDLQPHVEGGLAGVNIIKYFSFIVFMVFPSIKSQD